MQTTAAPLRTAVRNGESRPRRCSSTASTSHGITAPGSDSPVWTATVPSRRGENANTTPASSAGRSADPIARATRRAPSHATIRISADHSRWLTQPGETDARR